MNVEMGRRGTVECARHRRIRAICQIVGIQNKPDIVKYPACFLTDFRSVTERYCVEKTIRVAELEFFQPCAGGVHLRILWPETYPRTVSPSRCR